MCWNCVPQEESQGVLAGGRGIDVVLKHSWLPLGAEGKTDCMEAEHQVKDKTAAAELLTRQNQLETVMT